jgi:hypothetical protein
MTCCYDLYCSISVWMSCCCDLYCSTCACNRCCCVISNPFNLSISPSREGTCECDNDIVEQLLDLRGSTPGTPHTQPKCSGFPITIAYSSSSDHRINSSVELDVNVVSFDINSFILSYTIYIWVKHMYATKLIEDFTYFYTN